MLLESQPSLWSLLWVGFLSSLSGSTAKHNVGAKTRAPLGAKTTNAKAKSFQTPAVLPEKDLNKTQVKPTSSRRLKQRISHADTIKLEVHGDNDPLEEREVEYCPPPVPYPKYESEDFPDGGLNYEPIRGANLMYGHAQYYHNPLDSEGNSIRAKKLEAEQAAVFKKFDAKVLRELEEMDWSISDVPESREMTAKPQKADIQGSKMEAQVKVSKGPASRAPSTIKSRMAASALAAPARAPLASISSAAVKAKVPAGRITPFLSRNKQPVVTRPANSSTMSHTAATAASRSTIGYTKGRTASSVLKAFSPPPKPPASLMQASALEQTKPGPQSRLTRGLPRSASNASSGSDRTITPDVFAKQENGGEDFDIEQFRRLKLLSAFDPEDGGEQMEEGVHGESKRLAELLKDIDEEEGEFVLELGGA